jgi:hypothetical protein
MTTAPWLLVLDEKSRERVKELVAQSGPPSDEQRQRLRLLFRNGR